ncbi:fc74d115-2bc4-4e71-923f-3180ed392a2f [Sclerotinia trifoliorum]|uniref:Fc74d115-2bc4-4e71-923f-3180ed392a2f n=1 Tax=Sclerotinia trifoliorum TaxID=28548 RepID=A0A8H2VZG4_9HELO|nr:fc74d115-2bc4-4e71-923f-3180ed392a2f [Sclerotinia trifoliorum]
MASDNNSDEKSSTKILRIDNAEEFPALSSNSKPSGEKTVTTSNWGSLFPSKVPKPPYSIHHPSPSHHRSLPPLPTLPVTPQKEMSSPRSHSIGKREHVLLSPTNAECTSIMSDETMTEVEEANTPWNSPTENNDNNISVVKDGDLGGGATAEFPDSIAIETTNPPQKELLPPFKFPDSTAMLKIDHYNSSPKLAKVKNMEFEELCEAERHDTPSYIEGGLPLLDVVMNDPHRVIHAIKHMMQGIIFMKRALGAPRDELEHLMNAHSSTLDRIDDLREKERLARLSIERKKSEIKMAQLVTENEHIIAFKEMEHPKSATRFNPDAKPFSPSRFMPSKFMSPTPPFATVPTIQTISPLKYSILQEPGFMVEQNRSLHTQAKFHPLLNRSRTWSAQSRQRTSFSPYIHFNAYRPSPMTPIFLHQVPSPPPMVSSQLPWNFLSKSVDSFQYQTTLVQSPPQSPKPIQSQVNISLVDKSMLRTPVSGKTDHRSTPTSPTRHLSAHSLYKASSTNTSPQRSISTNQTVHSPQLYKSKLYSSKNLIPPTATAEDIQRAVLLLPRSYRHICPSSFTTPDFKCPVPNCMLQQICPDFTSENGCSFRPPPLSDWPWKYPPRGPLINQSQQCKFVHIPGTCLHSLSFYRVSGSSFEKTLENSYPATSSHYCPIPNCAATRFHNWGCAKDWKTGFTVNGLTPCIPSYNNTNHPQAPSENSSEWRWRLAMEGLRFAHERGEYGCQGGSIPTKASFPRGHKGADLGNWALDICTRKSKSSNGKSHAKEERGRLRGGSGMGSTRRRGSRGGSSDTRRKPTRENSTKLAKKIGSDNNFKVNLWFPESE